MSLIDIDQLAYNLKGYKDETGNGAIVFLGAGASQSANIPLADDIIKDIFTKYGDSPALKRLTEEEKKSYTKVMGCLSPHNRKNLFQGYIKNAQINITHIYLAQLMQAEYVDYILTVNFDNLTLRALSLFNMFPATYDIAMLKDFTTATFNNPGIVFLHGQHQGFNLLNTDKDFAEIEPMIMASLLKICARPWIVVGYSANDPVFGYLNKLGGFDDGLYWVCYKNNDPREDVKNLITEANKHAFMVKGHNSDSFFQKLHTEIQILDKAVTDPKILSKPFSHLKDLHDSIVEINDELLVVKNRMKVTKGLVLDAINRYENANNEKTETRNDIKVDILLSELINSIIKEDFKQIPLYKAKLKDYLNNEKVRDTLSAAYSDWGNDLFEFAMIKPPDDIEAIFLESFEKYAEAVAIKPEKNEVWFNWGIVLSKLAEMKDPEEAEPLYYEASEKFATAVRLKPEDDEAWNNWGVALENLAQLKDPEEAEQLYLEAFKKYAKATQIKPDRHETWNNWAVALGKLAEIKNLQEAETLFIEAFSKFSEAISTKSDYSEAWNNWGVVLSKLAEMKNLKEAELLYSQVFSKFEEAIRLKSDNYEAWNNWGIALGRLADMSVEKRETLRHESISKFSKAIHIKSDYDEAWNNWGVSLVRLAKMKNLEEAELLYQESFSKFEKVIRIKPNYANAWDNWGIALANLAQIKSLEDAEILYRESFLKFKEAVRLKPKYAEAWDNWGIALVNFAYKKSPEEAEPLYKEARRKFAESVNAKQNYYKAWNNWSSDLIRLSYNKSDEEKRSILLDALEKSKKAMEFGDSAYNYACASALLGNREEAFKYLEECLLKQQITFEHVENDKDWLGIREDDRYIKLKDKYGNK